LSLSGDTRLHRKKEAGSIKLSVLKTNKKGLGTWEGGKGSTPGRKRQAELPLRTKPTADRPE